MRIDYPEFFQDNIGQSVQEPNSGTNSPLVGENYNDPIPQAQQGPISLQETLGEFLYKQSQPIILFRKSLRRTPADLEPSERDIGELSQPPSTEIRSVPSHALGNPGTAFSDWLSVGHLVNRRYLSNHWVSRNVKATSVS